MKQFKITDEQKRNLISLVFSRKEINIHYINEYLINLYSDEGFPGKKATDAALRKKRERHIDEPFVGNYLEKDKGKYKKTAYLIKLEKVFGKDVILNMMLSSPEQDIEKIQKILVEAAVNYNKTLEVDKNPFETVLQGYMKATTEEKITTKDIDYILGLLTTVHTVLELDDTPGEDNQIVI